MAVVKARRVVVAYAAPAAVAAADDDDYGGMVLSFSLSTATMHIFMRTSRELAVALPMIIMQY